MACGCGCGGAHKFTKMTGKDLAKTLTAKLTPVVDMLRDLRVQFGQRPYSVRIVRTRWSGGRRGIGEEFVSYEQDLLPTPKVADLGSLQEVLGPVGLDEVGGLVLTEISPRYTEDNLRGTDELGNGPEPDEQVYYEVEFPRYDGLDGERRRFVLRTSPTFKPEQFQWEVRLERSHAERTRQGAVK